MEQKIVVSRESYVERWAREQREKALKAEQEKVVKPEDEQNTRGKGRKAKKDPN